MKSNRVVKKVEVEYEFSRIAEILASQGDVDVLCDLISYADKKQFIKDWKDGENE